MKLKTHSINSTFMYHKIEKIIHQILYSSWIISIMIIQYSFFKPLPGETIIVSASILISLLFIFTSLAFWLANHFFYQEQRVRSMVAQAILPFGLYNVIAYGINPPLIIFVLPAVGISVLWLYLFFKKRTQMLTSEICYYLYSVVRRNLAISFSLYMFFIVIGGYTDRYAYWTPVTPPKYEQTKSISELSLLYYFQPKVYGSMINSEKTHLYSKIVEYEVSCLGIPHEIGVEVNDISTIGTYNESLHLITINRESLETENSMVILEVVLHEIHHAYIRSLVTAFDTISAEYENLYLLRFYDYLEYELDNYILPDKNPNEYYNQKVEIMAREFAAARLCEYKAAIKEYVNK